VDRSAGLPMASDGVIDALADELLDALDRTMLLPPITGRVAGFDLTAGYALAAELVQRRRARGERPVGRKLGFTNRAVWDLLGVDAPFWGTVYDSTVTLLDGPSGRVAIGPLAQPRLEPELVLHFESTPPANADGAGLLAHVDWVALGFEIVQCHFPEWTFQTADAVADVGVHGAIVVGPPFPLAGIPDPLAALRTFTIDLMRNGESQARGGGANVLGSPPRALAEVVAAAHDMPGWQPLRAGEIVTTGTLTALHPVRLGETWRIEATGLDLVEVELSIG
jgi:2-keto-4-pentenoate hydratase